MKNTHNSYRIIESDHLSFTFLNSGDLYAVNYKNIMLNQCIGNPIDGSLNNLYLRLHTEQGIKAYPLLGAQSQSKVFFTDSQVYWEGLVEEIHYQVIFTLSKQGIWFWEVNLEGADVDVDLIYGQDVGIADKGAVLSNEAYLSQYIHHSVFQDDQKGYVVCSRQNMPQQNGFPYLQQGALTKAVGYSTDGFQFFGLSYKETNVPEVLSKEALANEIYQYEFAYTALQSERLKLEGQAKFVFYGLYRENHSEAITVLEYTDEINQAWGQVKLLNQPIGNYLEKVSVSHLIGPPFQTKSMTKQEIDTFYPFRHQEEWDGEKLLSFFTDTYEHIVLKEKELLVERPHGHILMTGQNVNMESPIITTTSFMYGIFNSQLVIGNTSFNKMLSNARNALNILKTSGQRIYVKLDGVYRLLTMPSMFEIGFNYARWFYKTDDDMLIITNYTTVDTPEVHLQVSSEKGKSYRYLVTNQVIMNANEYEAPFLMEQDNQTITFRAGTGSMIKNAYPDLCYRLRITGTEFNVEDERKIALNAEPSSASLVVLELNTAAEWTLTVQGLLHGQEFPFIHRGSDTEIAEYRSFLQNVMNGFQLKHKDESTAKLEKMNAIAWWYTHNMLVHYSVPHGLEQYGGAAWGTRDVCQGPSEYFMATQNDDAVREILKTVYSHQYEDNGNWPQWFMFDNYFTIQHDESHGDIIVWPLKVLTDYLNMTNDFSILNEKVPFTKRGSFEFTEETATIYDHAKKEIEYIKNHFLHDTYLSSYGDGDWDDTLQPANEQLKKYLVSSWTVALTYQVIMHLANALTKVDVHEADKLKGLAYGIETDFNKYILPSGVIPGFIYMEKPEEVELMLHPSDEKTGITYRLLPMTRSMISELLNPEQAEFHYQLIKQELYCPDGVRLMNRPAQYKGGVSVNFKRAEQAANFGREIGLQYVHAHIRFVEAMAKLGKVEEAWHGLELINPIGIQEVVPNAELRQSNTYFSSSDGKFNTRYDAQERFEQLRKGAVGVKGGWRIYSSGPGIFMNQLISNCLGVRREDGDLILDPVLPLELDGLQFTFRYMEKPVTFIYNLKNEQSAKVLINGQEVPFKTLENRYRKGGYRISSSEVKNLLKNTANTIEILM
jgi:1,2-beta-oligoglucan phosphorylase